MDETDYLYKGCQLRKLLKWELTEYLTSQKHFSFLFRLNPELYPEHGQPRPKHFAEEPEFDYIAPELTKLGENKLDALPNAMKRTTF